MTRLTQTIIRARRRELISRALHTGAMGLWIACAAGIVLLAIDRFMNLGLPLTGYGVLAVGGFVIGCAHAVFTHPDLFATALRIDRALHLKDRVATACVLADAQFVQRTTGSRNGSAARQIADGRTTLPWIDPEFADLVRRDAEHLAGRLDIRTIAPVRFSRAWAGVIVLAPLLALGALYLPSATPAEARAPEPQLDPVALAEAERERERVRESIRESVEALREDADPDDPRMQEELDALERLAAQLGEPDRFQPDDVKRARDESAARLSELADRLEEQSRRDRMAEQQLLERFAGLDAPEPPMTAEEFDRALRRGDFGTAAERLQEQLDERDALPPQQRDDFVDHLRALDQELERAVEESREAQQERRAQLEQRMQDHGIDDETARELLDDSTLTRSEIEEALRDTGLDEDILQRMMRDLERFRDQDHIEEQVERDIDAIRESLQEAMREFDPFDEFDPLTDDPFDLSDLDPSAIDPADPLDEPVDPAEPEDPAERADDPDRDHERDEQREDQPHEDDPERAKEREDDEQRQERAEEAQEQQERQQQAEREQQQAVDEEGRPIAEPDTDPAAQPGEEQDDAQQQPAGAPEGDPDAADEEAAMPDQDEQQEMADPSMDPGEGQCPSDGLRQLDERRKQGDERRQRSEELRERVRRMLDEDGEDRAMPAAERDLSDRLDEQLARAPRAGDEAGVGDEPIPHEPAENQAVRDREYMTEDIDLRDDEVMGELIADWLSDEPREGAAGRTDRELTEQQIRRVREIAERAVEDAAVPSRYHQRIRRFFGRLGETLDDGASSETPSSSNTDRDGS